MTACDAIGYYADLVATDNSGRTWLDHADSLPAGVEEFSAITCASVSSCLITGANPDCQSVANPHLPCLPQIYPVLFTEDAGRTWSEARLPSDLSLTGVSCPSTASCDAVAFDGTQDSGEPGSIITTADGGGLWSSTTVPSGTGAMSAVACPSVTVCYAVGQGTGDVGALILRTGSA